jgi:uncharacterized protein YlxW (UPF0749 family)
MQSVGDKQAEIRQREEGIARCDAENTELNTKRNELQNKLKELQRTEASVKRYSLACAEQTSAGKLSKLQTLAQFSCR